ncbi:unnamed protein product [Urochloa humidicola]
MAEVLAGLLTSAIVGIAKDKLSSAIAGQANLLWNFSDDLEDMNSVLESISAALEDAEKRSAKEKSVQLWLKRLKHAAIDISDMLEDYQDTSDQLTAKLGLDIAKKCAGVALAAQALGYMLQSKDPSEWIEINNSYIWNESSEDNGGIHVLPSLKLSYERMIPQLRICFSYCAIFPKGYNITEDDLIHQWIALDFIKPSKGKEYIRQLLGMSFLQVSKLPKTSGDNIGRYTMHDLVHDLATIILGDELIVSHLASENNNAHNQKYCRYASVTKYEQATKLSNVLPPKVRALHFPNSDKLELYCGEFSFAKCLRILDFSGCSSILLPASIGQLKQLKYLVAPRMQNKSLPEYITELTKLQYLNLDGSSHISALPESIGKLRCLKYLGFIRLFRYIKAARIIW